MGILPETATILVVDDNPTNLAVLDYALSNAGYNVRIEVDGLNVLKQVRLSIPDLILLDIMLPDITGFEICQQLKADAVTASIPIIFMTALVDTVDIVKGFSLGAVDYITKPFQEEELLARVRTHLHLHQLSKTLEIKNQQLLKLTHELENRVAARTVELQKALAAEKELNQLKSRFITMVSHEFRTPLAIISSSSGILQQFSDRLSEDRKKEHLEIIQNTIIHITQMLDDILMINSGDTEKFELQLDTVDIITFCRQIIEGITDSTQPRKINLSVDFRDIIPPDSLMVKCDQKLLKLIFTNLLSNAIKYSHEQDLVEVTFTKKNNKLIFKISDGGIGIPEADQVNLFSPFHRGSNIGTIPGTGLGLAIVKQCLDLHKGKIHIESQVGTGTICTVTIPYLSA
jgi:two-component system, sensor histidine kinase and response regulator